MAEDEKSPRIKKLTKEFERYQNAKYSDQGNVEARTLEALCAVHGDHYAEVYGGMLRFTHSSAGARIPLNFIRNRRAKVKGRLSAGSPVFRAQPDTSDPTDIDNAKVVDKLTLAIDQKVNQPAVTGKILDWLLDAGMAVEHVPWIPNKSREPMPVRVEDKPEIAEAFPEADPRELIFTDNTSGMPLPQSYRDRLIQGGQRYPEQFTPMEEIRDEGDVGSEVHGPLTFFTDISVTDIHDLSPDQSIMFAYCKDRSWIEENFDEDRVTELNGGEGFDSLNPDENIAIVKTNLSSTGRSLTGLRIDQMLPSIQGSKGPNDPDMFVVICRYQDRSKKNPDGRMTYFIPNQLVLSDGPNPYGDGIPAEVFTYDEVTTTLFTTGWVTDQIPVACTVDRFVSDFADYLGKVSKTPILGAPGATEEDWGQGNVTRFIENGLDENSNPRFRPAEVAQMPPQAYQLLDMLRTFQDDLAGGSDLFQQKNFPGQLRGSNAIMWLQEILDTQYGPLFGRIGHGLARVKQRRINRWKQKAPAIRTLHYVGRDDRVEVFNFHKSEILSPNVEYNITVERGSLVPEPRAVREARIKERLEGPLQVMYIDDRTGGFDKSKIAADLMMGDYSREEREAKPRKLARDIIARLRDGQPAPQPRQWMDPSAMMSEFEETMNDMDFLESSQQVQQAIEGYYNILLQFAQQRAEQTRNAMLNEQQQGAMAEAMQQTLARAQAETVDAAKDAMRDTVSGFVQQLTNNPEFVNNLLYAAGQSMGRGEV